jgi:hypothetical protein
MDHAWTTWSKIALTQTASPAWISVGLVDLSSDARLVELPERLVCARRCGAEFEVAWLRAVAAAMRDATSWEREIYARALADTAWSWQAAYSGEPATRVERTTRGWREVPIAALAVLPGFFPSQ